uniref:NAC domain-containing protein n=1 Tax=Ananas comosus var. bracteatus TaxID=296719 RepID=A0A6V7PEQ0_ANACO|nr:unnamed protein product [Ananas comosus var. bracteatus]
MPSLFPRNGAAAEPVAVGRVGGPRLRLHPTDEQLIVHYLRAYAAGQSLRWDHVVEAQVYSTDPRSLLGDDGEIGYFLTKRTRHGNRVKRTAGRGTWAGQTKKNEIVSAGGQVIGFKAMFSFCIGDDDDCSKKPSKKTTGYVMYEYELPSTANQGGIARTGPVLHQEERKRDREEPQKKAGGSGAHTCGRNRYCGIRSQRQQRQPCHLVSDGLLGRTMAADQQQPIPYHGKNVATANADFFEVGECSYSSTITEYADSVASADGVKEREMANGDRNLACHGALGMTADIDLLPIPYLRKWREMMNADIFYGLRGDVNTGDIGCSAAVEGAGDPQPPPPSYELNGTTAAAATADQQLLLAPDQDERTVVEEAGDWDQLPSVLENEDYSDWFDSVLNDEPSPPPLVDSEMPFRNCQMPPPASSDGAASSAVIQGNEHAGESMRKEM